MSKPRILIAGVGNVYFGDDGFGVVVADRLAHGSLGTEVRVQDFGIRSLDLSYALLDGFDAVILVDAFPSGQPPGALFVIEPSIGESLESTTPCELVDAHGIDLMKVLRLAASLGAPSCRVFFVGCEPDLPGNWDAHIGISSSVSTAVDHAVAIIEELVIDLLRDGVVTPPAFGGKGLTMLEACGHA